MSDDHATLCNIGGKLRQLARDIFVGKPVEPIAANALCIELFGKRVAVGDVGMTSMERGIEARNLR